MRTWFRAELQCRNNGYGILYTKRTTGYSENTRKIQSKYNPVSGIRRGENVFDKVKRLYPATVHKALGILALDKGNAKPL